MYARSSNVFMSQPAFVVRVGFTILRTSTVPFQIRNNRVRAETSVTTMLVVVVSSPSSFSLSSSSLSSLSSSSYARKTAVPDLSGISFLDCGVVTVL